MLVSITINRITLYLAMTKFSYIFETKHVIISLTNTLISKKDAFLRESIFFILISSDFLLNY